MLLFYFILLISFLFCFFQYFLSSPSLKLTGLLLNTNIFREEPKLQFVVCREIKYLDPRLNIFIITLLFNTMANKKGHGHKLKLKHGLLMLKFSFVLIDHELGEMQERFLNNQTISKVSILVMPSK